MKLILISTQSDYLAVWDTFKTFVSVLYPQNNAGEIDLVFVNIVCETTESKALTPSTSQMFHLVSALSEFKSREFILRKVNGKMAFDARIGYEVGNALSLAQNSPENMVKAVFLSDNQDNIASAAELLSDFGEDLQESFKIIHPNDLK